MNEGPEGSKENGVIRASHNSPGFPLPSDDARARMHKQADSFITPGFHTLTGRQGAERSGKR